MLATYFYIAETNSSAVLYWTAEHYRDKLKGESIFSDDQVYHFLDTNLKSIFYGKGAHYNDASIDSVD